MKNLLIALFIMASTFVHAQKDKGVHSYPDSDNSSTQKKNKKKNKNSYTYPTTAPTYTNPTYNSPDTNSYINNYSNYTTSPTDTTINSTNIITDTVSISNLTYPSDNSAANAINNAPKKTVRGYIALTFTLGMHPALKRYGGTASTHYNYSQYDYTNGITQPLPVHFSKQFVDRNFLLEIGLLGWEKDRKSVV